MLRSFLGMDFPSFFDTSFMGKYRARRFFLTFLRFMQLNVSFFLMVKEQTQDTTVYKVVVNHEEQYSLWPAHKDLPSGWKEVGKSGLKDECLAYIKGVWTDMRPLSLRKKMEKKSN